MKKIAILTLIIFSIFSSLISISAEEGSNSFVMSSDGKSERKVENDDMITVNITLKCGNPNGCILSAFQDEIVYDEEFYAIVDDSILVLDDVRTNDIKIDGRYRAFYVNFVGINNDIRFTDKITIGSVQFKIIAKDGVSRLKNTNCLLVDENGNQLELTQNKESDLTTIINDNIQVHLKDEDTLLKDVYVEYQKPMKKPNVQNSEGLVAQDWTTDKEGEHEWNFESNVEENMTIHGSEWTKKECKCYWWILIAILFVVICYAYYKTRNRKTNS